MWHLLPAGLDEDKPTPWPVAFIIVQHLNLHKITKASFFVMDERLKEILAFPVQA